MSHLTAAYPGKLWVLLLATVLLSFCFVATSCRPTNGDDSDYFNSLERLRSSEVAPSEDLSENLRYPINAKRALSLFANWKPYYNGPSENKLPGSDFVSAVARGGGSSRPLGQPLRWG